MKRMLTLFLLLALLLCGCSTQGQLIKEPVTFYYILEEYEYGGSASVIASEEREAAGHRDDLSYLLALYQVGPSVDGLRSPLPRGTRIYSVVETTAGVNLKMSDTSATMSEAEFTRACACLSLTCLDLTDADKVNITSGTRSVSMTRDSLILYDAIHVSAMEDSE